MDEGPPISHRPAAPGEMDGLFDLMMAQTGHYLDEALKVLGITVDQFTTYFRSVGQVWAIEIEMDTEVVGFYWIELRAETLHIHGLVLKSEYQNRGLGTATMKLIEQCLPQSVSYIEVGVHESNAGAQSICKTFGFTAVRQQTGTGFTIYQKRFGTS
ncbi:GNAT family N-acetyltransferase [candidate division GN15 bacterium]|nr:GNAT family N-acetyltransferase [candidate division GN15 bacterium]